MKEKTCYPEEKSMWGNSTWCGGECGLGGFQLWNEVGRRKW